MKIFHNLAKTRTPDGSNFTLHEHDGEYYLKLNGRQLMSTIATTSEILLARLACKSLKREPNVRVLIGGLGLGFSLREALDCIGRDGEVHVAELLPEVVEWNRTFLQKVNGKLLDDPRVKVLIEDVFTSIKRGTRRYDAILLDVDNGPTSFVQPQNSQLYDKRGFRMIANALKPGGIVSFWSAGPEPDFARKLGRAGFDVEEVQAPAHETAKRCAHRIYVAELLPPVIHDPDAPKPERKKPEPPRNFRRRQG